MQTPPAEKAPPPGSAVGRWGRSVGPPTPTGRNVSTTRLASRLKFVESPRGGAIGPRAPALRVSAGGSPAALAKPLTWARGPSRGRSCPLDPRSGGGTQALRGWRRGQASPHPQENFTPSSLPPSLNFYHRISVRLSVSRSCCGSLPPSSPGTADTGPQPSDLDGHRASHMPCPSPTPGG